MTPQLQLYRMRGEGDPYGDCHRTCIGMILDMQPEQVPHFMADLEPGHAWDDPAARAAEQAERDWLAGHGLSPVYVPIDGSVPLADVASMLGVWSRDAPVILGGCTASGGTHSVVWCGGFLHDPLGNECRLVGPQPDGYWWLTIYSVGPDWGLRGNGSAARVRQQEEAHGN